MRLNFLAALALAIISAKSACAESIYTLQGVMQAGSIQNGQVLSASDLSQIMEKSAIVIAIDGNILESSPLKKIYQARNFSPIWVDQMQWTAMANSFEQVMKNIGYQGLLTRDYLSPSIRALLASGINADNQFKAELLMSKAFFQLSQDLSIGRVDPQLVDQDIKYARKPYVDSQILAQILANGPEQLSSSVDALAPKIEDYQKLKQLLSALIDKKTNQTWMRLAPSKENISAGSSSATVAKLKAAIAQQGYAFEDVSSELMSDADFSVVQSFEFDHAIEPEATISKSSLIYKTLNATVDERIRQVQLSMEKLRWLPNQVEDRYVFVNLAATELFVHEQGQVVMQFHTVNGGPYRRTPSMRDIIAGVIFNPTWSAPTSIAIKDKIPAIRKDPGFLQRMNMRVLDNRTNDVVDASTVDWSQSPFDLARRFTFRMDPGPMNALGIVKFPLILNSDQIYMHDTNERDLFNNADRLRSSGCMRLQKPQEFAAYVLASEGWNMDQVQATIAHGQPGESFETMKYVRIAKESYLPVYTLFQTALVMPDGHVRFMRDVYGQDARLRARLGLSASAADDGQDSVAENF